MSTPLADFVLGLAPAEVPDRVRRILERSLADTLGVAAAGARTGMSRIARETARRHWRGAPEDGEARMLFDGRAASQAGAAMAGAFTVDAIDAHDGHTGCKGHAGSALVPALLACADGLRARGGRPDGPALLAALAAGYEVAYRAGLALHGTAADYHTSGAWTAIGVAVAAGRLLGLTPEQLRHAAGIAEYHGPRSPMMRCIDHPTMVRDGVGWGAPAGVMAAHMAGMGFTGAPALTVEGEAAAPWWSDLGERWETGNTNYKRYPVCRWAHPAIRAAEALMTDHRLAPADVDRVRIRTFHNATRLAGHEPRSLCEMSYAIAFPVAAMIVRGRLGLEELRPEVVTDPEILRISRATELVDDDELTRLSVDTRWAEVTIHTRDGRALASGLHRPPGDPDDPLSDDEFRDKFLGFVAPGLGEARALRLATLAESLASLDAAGVSELLGLATTPLAERIAAAEAG